MAVGKTLMSGVLALTSCGAAPQLEQEGVTVSVDANAMGQPLERVWAFFGYDELNYTTLPEGKALLSALANANGASVYVRNHFWLNTGDGMPAMKWGSTNVYTEDSSGHAHYDFSVSDGVTDAMADAGVFPFVELGFMPEALSTHPVPYRNTSTTALNGGCFYPPNNYQKWAALVRAWAEHAAERYPDAAPSWLWELWNEPDSAYWHGSFDDYAKLYDNTEAALHEVMPQALLGGPAVVNPEGSFLRQFLEHCTAGPNSVTGTAHTRLDLVTFHAKAGTATVDGHAQLDLGRQLRLHRAGFEAVAAFPELAQTPIYISEADPDGCAACPPSVVPGASYRTSTAYGAYELSMMKRTLELAAAMGVHLGGVLTWAFTFPDAPLFSGYRELASHGIGLPVFSAMSLLGKLRGSRLPLTSSGALRLEEVLSRGVRLSADVDGMAARNGDSVQVLVWSYHDDVVPAPSTPVHLIVKLPPSMNTRVMTSQLRVDDEHGDAYRVWVSQGSPTNPSTEQLAALSRAMAPSPSEPDRLATASSDGSVSLDFDLPRFAVSLVTLTPVGSNKEAAP